MNLLKENEKPKTMKRKRESISVDWSQLPPPVLENIYNYLGKSDQQSMSLVCKSWAQEYGSPSLWKTFIFDLSKGNLALEVCPEVKLAQKFGCMFKHVEIKGTKFHKDEVSKLVTQMQLFFEAILTSKCKLLSIKFYYLCDKYQNLNENEYSNLFQSIFIFMSTQKNLQTVEFHQCCYKNQDGINLMRLICESNACTLNTLVLDDCIIDRLVNENGNKYLNLLYRKLMQNFMNLQLFKVDYTQNFENIMCSLSNEIVLQNQLTKKLSCIELNWDDSIEESFKGIQPVYWQNLRKICPGVKVQFKLLYSSPIRNNFGYYLVKYIPLVHLNFQIQKTPDTETVEIVDLFWQICDSRVNEHLEYLSIVWMPAVGDISIDLIPFLQACQKLKTLQLFLRYPIEGMKELFDSWLQNRPFSLESVHLSIYGVTDEADRYFLMLLADEYSPLFQIIGLNLILLTEAE